MVTNENDILITGVEIDAILEAMSEQCSALIDGNDVITTMVGIHTGGVWVAEKLHALLQLKTPLAHLDASFHRDDYGRVGLKTDLKSSSLPVSLENHEILLVDDVLHTGRTIRAALNLLFEFGRPNRVRLITLIDRPGRELPIQADITGQFIHCDVDEHLKLHGPNPLQLVRTLNATT